MKPDLRELFPVLKRILYFDGRLLSAEDLKTEQQYFIHRLKLHNRYLHGYGVVTGLQVAVSNKTPSVEIVVSPGYAIDRSGNEIVVSAPQREPLPEKGEVTYLYIRWAERKTDYLPVPSKAQGSQDLTEASAVEEYAILEFKSEPPPQKHGRPSEDEEEADQYGLALARLTRKLGVWKIDKRFRVPRVGNPK